MMGSEVSFKKKIFGNEFSKKKKANKKIILVNMIYLMILFLICFLGGILLGFLTTSYTPAIHIIENDKNVFHFLSKDNKIIIGGKLDIKLNLRNNTILSYIFYSENVKYFYYPIGINYSCLLYNGGLQKSSNQIPLSYKSEIGIPLNNNEDIFATKLSIKIKYTLLELSSVIYTIPLHLGYEITDEYKQEIQPLYNDCKNFNRIYFSIRLDQLHTLNKIRKVYSDKKYELIFYCNCYIDNKVDSFFNSSPVNKKIILNNLINNPNLL
ncbi:conserved Plasmodium protein, unknown function [Plasmodium gallinaceum]|uniref:Uncharacterized protein n=1 Tax=Plasmodium gallinaceum TaxID=5849 RepID=A0A1J1GNP6_PLAGA|nr:conserved Plasmodium protein, unknown function [Plasmodium gallinaceum]CRG94105.1 conserved Plasmodium protein, unknown function [Plasmodium gallinaceum]